MSTSLTRHFLSNCHSIKANKLWNWRAILSSGFERASSGKREEPGKQVRRTHGHGPRARDARRQGHHWKGPGTRFCAHRYECESFRILQRERAQAAKKMQMKRGYRTQVAFQENVRPRLHQRSARVSGPPSCLRSLSSPFTFTVRHDIHGETQTSFFPRAAITGSAYTKAATPRRSGRNTAGSIDS